MRIPQRILLLQLFACLVLLCVTARSQEKPQVENSPKYHNSALAIDDRVADLLSRMTLEEKVGQLTGGGEGQTSVIDPTGTFTDETARATLQRWWDPDQQFTPKRAAILRNGVQRK